MLIILLCGCELVDGSLVQSKSGRLLGIYRRDSNLVLIHAPCGSDDVPSDHLFEFLSNLAPPVLTAVGYVAFAQQALELVFKTLLRSTNFTSTIR